MKQDELILSIQDSRTKDIQLENELDIAKLMEGMSNDATNVAFLAEQITEQKKLLDAGKLINVHPDILAGAQNQTNLFDENGVLISAEAPKGTKQPAVVKESKCCTIF